jgi:hypothetical protein
MLFVGEKHWQRLPATTFFGSPDVATEKEHNYNREHRACHVRRSYLFVVAVWKPKEAKSAAMSRIILIGVIAVTLLPSARGRLWETREQVAARYGKPIHCDGDQNHGIVCTYNYQRFRVVVTFLDGKSQSELFYRADNKYLVPIEILKIDAMNMREHYVWEPRGRISVLVQEQNQRGQPIAISARFPDTRNPWSFHICTAEFAKKFGSTPPKVKP